jgi:hypothetical protein
MPTFESINDLERYINQNLERSMDTISKDVTKELKKNYNELWYDQNIPNNATYKRTKQLLKGIETRRYIFDNSQNKFFDYEIGYFGTRIKPKYDKKRYYNAYMSLDKSTEYGGMPITEAIAYWIEKGTSSPYYSISARHVFQKTAREYNRDRVEARIRNLLTRRGIGFA